MVQRLTSDPYQSEATSQSQPEQLLPVHKEQNGGSRGIGIQIRDFSRMIRQKPKAPEAYEQKVFSHEGNAEAHED